MPSYTMKRRWKKSTKSWKSLKWDHAQNPFVTICRKGNMIFSEESSRAIYEMGNMELIELRQASATSSVFLAWNTYQRDWTCVYVASGFDPIKVRWTESEQHLQRWKLLTYRTSVSLCQEKRSSGHNQWQMDHQKPWMQKEGQRNAATNTPLYWTDGRTTKFSKLVNVYTVGLTSGSSTSTTSPRLTSVMMHLTDSDYDMKAHSTWEASIPKTSRTTVSTTRL